MALPGGLSSVVVTATNMDPSGVPRGGYIDFVPTPHRLISASGDKIIGGTTRMRMDSSGHGSITLLATDAAGVLPTDWSYQVTEKLTGMDVRVYNIKLPAATSTVDLADVAPSASDPGVGGVGDKGPTGDKGPAGDKGPTGDTGPTTWVPDYIDDMLSPGHQRNIPTIAWTAVRTTGLTTPVEYKPPGVDGGSKVSNSTGATDANIRWYSAVYETLNGGAADVGFYGMVKTGGDAQFARYPLIFEFNTVAANTVVEISGYALSGNAYLNIEVDGRMISRYGITRPVATTSWTMLMTFPIAAARKIRVWMDGTAGVCAVRVPTGQSISKPTATIVRRFAILGDSWAAGTGTNGSIDLAFSTEFARLMGADDIFQVGIGSRGFVAGTGGTAGAPNPYSVNVSEILSKNPHAIAVNGSINDGASGAGVAAAAAAFFSATAAVPKIYVFGVMLSGYSASSEILRQATIAAGRTWLGLDGFIYGSGSVSDLKGDGNKDFLLGTDKAHPIVTGHRALAVGGFRSVYST